MTRARLDLFLFFIAIICTTRAILTHHKTSFFLATRGDPYSLKEIDQNLDKTDVFKHTDTSSPNRTVVLLHGLGGDVNSSSNTLVAEALLSRDGYTIIIAGYKQAAEGPDYITAAKNMESVGKDVAKFLLRAQEVGYVALSSTTLIGFSLGAHVAGVAGYTIKEASGYLDRIIGLDPPLPWYSGVGDELKLDKSDAGHVIVIHTASGYLSVIEPIGDVDFYPNGGTETQPLCEFSKLSSIGDLITVVCSHIAAYRYLAESITRPGFIATKCDSWEAYQAGVCDRNQKAYMGFDTDPTIEGTYFLKTNKEPPFGSPLVFDDVEGRQTDAAADPEVLQENEVNPSQNYNFYLNGVRSDSTRLLPTMFIMFYVIL